MNSLGYVELLNTQTGIACSNYVMSKAYNIITDQQLSSMLGYDWHEYLVKL